MPDLTLTPEDLHARARVLIDGLDDATVTAAFRYGWMSDPDATLAVVSTLDVPAYVWAMRSQTTYLEDHSTGQNLFALASQAAPDDDELTATFALLLARPTERIRHHLGLAKTVLLARNPSAEVVTHALAQIEHGLVPDLAFLELLVERTPPGHADLWTRAIDSADPARRALAIDQLCAVDPEAAYAAAFARLADKRKPNRLIGCELLAALPHRPEDLPALRAAHASERTADVAGALAELLYRGVDDAPVTREWAVRMLADQRTRRLPKFVTLEALGRLRWADGEELDARQRKAVVTLLMQEDDGNAGDAIRRLRPLLDGTDCARWCEVIERGWAAAGSPARHKWAAYQIGVFGDDARVDAVALELPEFAKNNYWKRATWYLDAFARLGTDRALSWLLDLFCHTHRGYSIHDHTQRALEPFRAAETPDAPLIERLDPYIRQRWRERDLDAPPLTPGEATLSTNARTFTVLMDRELRLVLRDESGARFTDKIRLVKGEQKATRDQVLKDLKALRAQVDAFVDVWRVHLEEAMVSGRPFTAAYLRERFLSDPVMTCLIQTLVWRDGAGRMFRFADGEPIDVDYAPLDDLDPGARLTLAHPAEMEPPERSAWTTHLVDAELGQVFPQIARPVYTRQTHPPEGLSSPGGLHAFRLGDAYERSGWSRLGYMTFTSRNVRAEVSAAEYTYTSTNPDETGIEGVEFMNLWYEPAALDDADPVVYSEVYLGVTRLLEVGGEMLSRSRR
jgi:hypothetical protein